MADKNEQMKAKILELIGQIVDFLTDEEHRSRFDDYLSIFIKKTSNFGSQKFLNSFIEAFVFTFKHDDIEKRAAAVMLLISLVKRIDEKESVDHSEFIELVEEGLGPKLFDLSLQLKNGLEEIDKGAEEKSSYEVRLMKFTILGILVLMIELIETFRKNKAVVRKLEKLNEEMKTTTDFEFSEEDFSNVNFDIIETEVNVFDRNEGGGMADEGLETEVRDYLETLKEQREILYNFMIDNSNENTAQELDQQLKEYLGITRSLHNLIGQFQNIEIDQELHNQVQKEIFYANFILKDVQDRAGNEEIDFNELLNILTEKYEEIFLDDENRNNMNSLKKINIKDKSMEVPNVETPNDDNPTYLKTPGLVKQKSFKSGVGNKKGQKFTFSREINENTSQNNSRVNKSKFSRNESQNNKSGFSRSNKGATSLFDKPTIIENKNKGSEKDAFGEFNQNEEDNGFGNFNVTEGDKPKNDKSGFDDSEFKSFNEKEGAFKDAFKQAGNFGFDDNFGFGNNNAEESGFNMETENSGNQQGFDADNFGNFDEFNVKQTDNTENNFSGFNNDTSNIKKDNKEVINEPSIASIKNKTSRNESRSTIRLKAEKLKLQEELTFKKKKERRNVSFKNFLSIEQDTIIPDKRKRTSFSTRMRERFRSSRMSISGIDKKSDSTFMQKGSINFNFGGSKFNSKNENMLGSKVSTVSVNKNMIKNAMSRNLPTVLSNTRVSRSATIKPRTKTIPAERGKIVHRKPSNPPNEIINNKVSEKPVGNNNSKEHGKGFGFDDFQSVPKNNSVSEEVSGNLSKILPESLKFNNSRQSKIETPFDNHTNGVRQSDEFRMKSPPKPLSVKSKSIKQNNYITTPFDNIKNNTQSEKKIDELNHDLDTIKLKYNDLMDKHQRELKNINKNQTVYEQQVLKEDNKQLNEQVKNQKKEFDGFFEKMKNDYEVLIANFKSAYVEQQQANGSLASENSELQNRVFQLENDLENQRQYNNLLKETTDSQRTQYQDNINKQREQIKQNYESRIKKLEKENKVNVTRLNKEIERIITDSNEKVNKYLIENNNIKLELDNERSAENTKYYELKKTIDSLKSETTLIKSEFAGKIQSLSTEMKGLSPKFHEIVTLKNKLLNESMLNKSEITFYNKKANEFKQKIDKLEKENSLLKSKTSRSGALGDSNSLMNLKALIMNIKIEVKKFKEQLLQDAEEIKERIQQVKTLKASKKILETKLFNLEIQNNSRIGQINKLNFQFESMKEENTYLKTRISELLETKRDLQDKIVEMTKEPTNYITNTANDLESLKKIRELEFEINSLNEINKEITEENIILKEKVIKFEANDNSQRQKEAMRNLEEENVDLYEKNKSLLSELYELQKGNKTIEALKKRIRYMERELGRMRTVNEQLSARQNKETEDNLVVVDRSKQQKNYGSLKGTAFIKKCDMYLDLLNNKNKPTSDSNFLKMFAEQENTITIAKQCTTNNYTLFRNGGFKIGVEENIVHRTNNIDLVLKLIFTNFSTSPNFIMNFKVVIAREQGKPVSSGNFNVELNGMETVVKEIRIVFEENYLISGVPILAEFYMLENYKMKKFLAGEENSILNNNNHSLLFPIAINKLLIYLRADPNLFNILKNLKKVGSLRLRNLTNISKDDVYRIFPNLEIIGNNKYGVKILSIYGNFLLTLEINNLLDYNIELFSMYENPIHEIYIKTLKAILPLL